MDGFPMQTLLDSAEWHTEIKSAREIEIIQKMRSKHSMTG